MNVFRSFAVVSLLLYVGELRAQLATNSPFLPAPGSAAAAPAEVSPIELRGMMALGGKVQYYIYETAKGKGTWVSPQEKGNTFVIKDQDLAKETVTVEQSGRTFSLPMREAKVASSGQAITPLPTATTPTGPNAVTQNVVVNPTPADEQKRLDDVTAEVRRRRALRDQVSAQAATGQAAAQPATQTPAVASPQTQSAAAQNSALRRGQ